MQLYRLEKNSPVWSKPYECSTVSVASAQVLHVEAFHCYVKFPILNMVETLLLLHKKKIKKITLQLGKLA